ncbi:MAG: hypothetical protein JNL02_20255 [Saprospiraceae bacterium]|nr:hypothetical protein [Saprospiraceae bacterium]
MLKSLLIVSLCLVGSFGLAQSKRFVSDAGVEREYLRSYDSLRTATGFYDPDSEECNADNSIYLPGREFIFDYCYVRQGVPCKIDWMVGGTGLVDTAHQRPSTIRRVSYKILPGNMLGMTYYQNIYYTAEGPDNYYEASGLIENERNVWLHPPRATIFYVNEINPFPYIKTPLTVGTRWTWELEIGDHYSSSLWKKWSDSIVNRYEYAITGFGPLATPLGTHDCYEVSALANSEIGQTAMKAWFNPEYGFVRLDFTNVDGSQFLMVLTEVKYP